MCEQSFLAEDLNLTMDDLELIMDDLELILDDLELTMNVRDHVNEDKSVSGA